ncbi:MAG: cytidylate kinase [Planctomycetota bacterium]|nr:MAG: cytidylate kinase [Planctomycetota bacterium]
MTELLDVVAIDGPAGSGKSTVACGLAKELGYRHLDTGSMYRAITFVLLERGLPIEPSPALDQVLAELKVEVLRPGVVGVDGRELAAELRSSEVDAHVSPLAAISSVRRMMAALQRAQADYGPLVAEGRDMGSVVFPDARWKQPQRQPPHLHRRRPARRNRHPKRRRRHRPTGRPCPWGGGLARKAIGRKAA